MSMMFNRIANYQSALSSKGSQTKALIGIIQMRSTENREENFEKVAELTQKCSDRGAQIVCLPENFAYQVPATSLDEPWHEDQEDGFWINKYRKLAREHCTWLSMGSFPETNERDPSKYHNTHFIVNQDGQFDAKYRELHQLKLQVSMSGQIHQVEQIHKLRGKSVTEPISSPIGYLGMSVSNDLRYPEVYRKMAMQGAQIMLVPSAFLQRTGSSHFKCLLQARAIENQCFMIAAAQTGRVGRDRENFGHSMVVDPWGDIIAQQSDQDGTLMVEIDLDYLHKVRSQMNCLAEYRFDVFKMD